MNISVLVGKTLTSVVNNNNEEIIFTTSTGEKYKLYHGQDCCESVVIEDINGELEDLIGNEILVAEESCSNDVEAHGDKGRAYGYDSVTWTFYRIATIRGWVVIRWCGESNGYYSESVDFEQIA